jgi:hypothetical protein
VNGRNGRPVTPSREQLRDDWRDSNGISTHVRCPHGTRYGYQRYSCRGACCRRANRAYTSSYKRTVRTVRGRRRCTPT